MKKAEIIKLIIEHIKEAKSRGYEAETIVSELENPFILEDIIDGLD